MKKLIIFICTMISAMLLFLSVGAFNTYAEELPIEETTTDVEEESTTTEDVEETPVENVEESNKDLNEILNEKFTEDDAKKIAELLGEYTNNKDVESLTMTLYAEIGIIGVFVLIVFIVIVVLLFNKAKTDAVIGARLDSIRGNLTDEYKATFDALKEDVQNDNKNTKKLLNELINQLRNSKEANLNPKVAQIVGDLDSILNKTTKVE